MAKKVRIEGFNRPLDLDYSAQNSSANDNAGTKLATYYFNTNPTAGFQSYQFQPFSQVVNQGFTIFKIVVDAYAETNTPALIDLFIKPSFFSTPQGFNTLYPGGLYVNNYGIISSIGKPGDREVSIDCGESGVYVNPNETFVMDFTCWKTLNFIPDTWVVTDSIYVRVSMIWK